MKRNINKSAKEMYRYKLLIDTIERLEQRKHTSLDTLWCANTITWLWKWRKITKREMESLCDRIITINER